jgi:hypothetical protein
VGMDVGLMEREGKYGSAPGVISMLNDTSGELGLRDQTEERTTYRMINSR